MYAMKMRIIAIGMSVMMLCTELLSNMSLWGINDIEAKTQVVENQKYLGGMDIATGNSFNILKSASPEIKEDFILECYRADYCMNPETGTYRDFASLGQYELPSDIVVRLADENSTFQNSVAAWKSANIAINPSQIAKGMLDEKGYYEAIIFSVFIAQTGNRNFVYDIQKKSVNETNKVLSQIEKWVKETDGLDAKIDIRNGKISGLSLNDKEKVKKYLSKMYEESHPALKNISGIGSAVGQVFQTTDTIVGGVEMMTSYMQLSEMSESMKNVIMAMYNQCPSDNPFMKEALMEAAVAIQNAQGGFLSAVMSQSQEITADTLGGIVDGWWERLLSSHPYSKAFANGAKLGFAISNILFSTDKSIEQYEKMKCLGKFYKLLTKVNVRLGNDYKSSKTKENASSYLASVDALYTTAQLSCDFAVSYADVIYHDAAVGGLFLIFKQSTYDEYTRAIQGIKHVYKVSQSTFSNEYLYQLEEDYPDFFATENGEKVQATGMRFEMDEITIGLEDSYIAFPTPVLMPEEAGLAYADYSSSDESVFEIHGPIVVCEAKKVGTVTVTATSREGGYTDTITVHVVEGKGNVAHEIQGQMVIASGDCGNNVKWELFDGGILVVSGKGNMDTYKSPWSDYKVIKAEVREGITHIGNQAFRNCSSLLGVSLPEGLISIGEYSFCDCSSLMNVEIPGSVKNIGEYAFSDCSSLSEISLPEGLICIEKKAFRNCSKLQEMSLPKALVSVGAEAFDGCISLKNVILPINLFEAENSVNLVVDLSDFGFGYSCPIKDITFTGEAADKKFSGIRGINTTLLMKIILPEGIVEINDSALSGCSSLQKISVPEGVIKIGKYAFRNCSSLIKIDLPESLTSLGNGSFLNCKNLQKLTLPDGVVNVEEYAFRLCSSLSEVELSNNLIKIGEYAFSDCENLRRISFPKSLTTIGNYAFERCRSLKEISLPESVTYIGIFPFSECNLTELKLYVNLFTSENSVAFPGVSDSIINLRFLGKAEGKTFSRCSGKITNIFLPEGLTKIEDDAFSRCSNLEKISLPDSLVSIGNRAFKECSNLREINLPEGVTSIEMETFYGCNSLQEINLPEYITTIEMDAFSNCSNLEKISFPESLTSIGFRAFLQCSSLREISIPEGVTSIAAATFSGCSSLQKISLPESIISIGGDAVGVGGAFSYCIGLREITLPEKVSCIGEDTFRGCNSLEKVSFSKRLTSIGESAFSGCSSLREITLPEGVTSIERATFWGCNSLISVAFPKSIRKIDYKAFRDCSSLESIIFGAPSSINIEYLAFENCDKLHDIYYEGGENTWNVPRFGYAGLSDFIIHYNSTGSDASQPSEKPDSPTTPSNSIDNTESTISPSENVTDSDSSNPNPPVAQPNIYTITFHANGGKKLTQKSKNVLEGTAIGTLPKVIKNGYAFKGWYTHKTGGEKVTERMIVTKSQTLYARWSKVKKPGKVKSISVKSQKAGKLLLQYKKVKGASGYELSYSTNSKLKGGNTKKVYTTKLKKEIRKLKKGKKYYVRIRAYALDSAGRKIYGTYSAKKSIKIK